MLKVESKLTEWREIYDRHLDAQRRLAAAVREGRPEAAIAELREEVARLQAQSDEGLVEIQHLLRAVKHGTTAAPH